MDHAGPQRAFVLRIVPSGVDRVPDALTSNQVIIGWAAASGLLDPDLDWQPFRQIVHDSYYASEQDYRKSGAAGGQIWRFIRDMGPGDWIVVPHGPEFYMAEVTGPPTYDPRLVEDDSAYRRPVRWLNNKHPIERRFARAGLVSRMKTQSTCVQATDLLPEIREVLAEIEAGRSPSFDQDLRRKLIAETLREIQSGRVDDFRFESLVSSVLQSLGARDVRIVPRNQDKGADLLATFELARTFAFTVAVQAKHYRPDPPVGAGPVDQLAKGMEAEESDLGLVVTSGTFSDTAVAAAKKYLDQGKRIELVDGEQLAGLIIDKGLGQALLG